MLLLNIWQVLLLVGMVSWPAVLLLNTWQVLLLVAGILASCFTSEYLAGAAVGGHGILAAVLLLNTWQVLLLVGMVF